MTDKLKPIQLISFDQNKKITVNQQAVQWLMKANQQKHIGVVTVVGKYRTGKSYILNRVLLNQNSGFQVGPTVNACTKGLWVWPQLITNPNDPTIQYMVMDTQGLGSLEQGQQTDTKIFLMAMLLSSYFIYNSVGRIDQNALQNLSLIVNLSKLLQKGSQKEMQDIINCFPSFTWLLRDFALKLQDQCGRPISPQEYLQMALRLQPGNSELIARKNSVRKQLINFFKDRDCFMLIRPVQDDLKLQNMAKVKDSQLRPRFIQLVNQFRSKVMTNIKKKTFKGKPCSPAMFVQLCQFFASSINKGGLPEIQNNWDLVCRAQANRVQKRCLSDFKRFLQVYQNLKPKDVDLKKFQNQTSDLIIKILKYFQKNSLGDKSQRKRLLKQSMTEQFQKLKKKISNSKNQALNQALTVINNEVYQMITDNIISSIFQITEKYDSIIQKESQGSSEQTLSYIYKKCYQGLKTNCFTLFGNILQTQKHQKGLLQQKLGFYQQSLNRIQGDHTKKVKQFDDKERQLKNFIYQQQLKAKQTLQQLQKAKKQLHFLTQYKNSQAGPIQIRP